MGADERMGADRSRIARDVPPRRRRRTHLSQTRTQARSALERHAIATGFELDRRERAESSMDGAVQFGFLPSDGVSGEQPFCGIAKKTSVLVGSLDGVHSATRPGFVRLAATESSQAPGAKSQPALLRRQYEIDEGGLRQKELRKR